MSTSPVDDFGVEDDEVVVSRTGAVGRTPLVVSLVFVESALEVAVESECEKSVSCVSSFVAAVDVSCANDDCEVPGISDMAVVIASPQISNKALHPSAVHTPVVVVP